MSDDELLYRKDGHQAWITFNRPHVRNAMSWAMYSRLEELCEEIDGDPGVGVAIFRGAGGGAFVAGTDIRQFGEFRSERDALEYEQRIDRIVSRVERVSKPTIALLEGHCMGGGAAIALACDFRYATPELHFGVPIAETLGNCLSIANLQRLVDLLGLARTKELLMLARVLGAEEARAAGVVNAVFTAERIESEVRAVAERLSDLAPLTLRATKEALRRIQARSRSPAEEGEDLIVSCYMSEDFRAAVKAFTERRRHRWTGR
jgi:enoyl-CoA hydratase